MKNDNVRKRLKASVDLSNINIVSMEDMMPVEHVILKNNKNWAADWMKQNYKLRVMKETEPILFSKTPGLIMKWWEN